MLRLSARRLLIGVLTASVALGALAWVAGGELSAPVPREIGPPPSMLGASNVTFSSASGSVIHGWWSPGLVGQGAVLLLHGVRGDRRDMLSRAEFLHRLGFGVLLIDFQAHGESPGERITFGAKESRDVVAALMYMHRAAPNERVGVIGVSLGAAAFVLAEDRPPVDAVVLESMYPTIQQAVEDRLRLHLGSWGPALAPALLMQFQPRLSLDVNRLRPIDRIAGIGAPLLLIHGAADAHTSLAEAREVFAAAKDPKDFWPVEGAAHVNLHHYAKDEYERRVAGFLGKYLRSTSESSQ